MRNQITMLLSGLFLGAILFGQTAAHASGLIATPSTHHVTVDGQAATIAAYNINGNNYVKLRDIAALVDFGVIWNSATRSVEIHTDAPYTPETTEVAGSPDTEDFYAIREDIVRLVNDIRREYSVPALALDENLMAAAQVRAVEAAATITYRHTRPDGSDNDTVLQHTGTLSMGENLGMKDLSGRPVSDLARLQVESWRNSPAHFENLLRTKFHSTGVGISQDKFGMYYVVQVFGSGDYTITGIDAPIIP